MKVHKTYERRGKMIVGCTGRAGSGKSTVAGILVKHHGFLEISLADPIKRICKQVFGFTDEQLWGPSEKRNAPDKRYPRWVNAGEIHDYLTPRHALQQLGTQWGRECYQDIWIDTALRAAKEILDTRNWGNITGMGYFRNQGVIRVNYGGFGGRVTAKDLIMGVVIPDIRFHNECEAIRKAGGVIWKTQHGTGLEGAAGQHESERHIDDLKVDAVVPRSTLEEMPAIIASMLRGVSK